MRITEVGLVLDSPLSFIDEANVGATDTGAQSDFLGLVIDAINSLVNEAAVDRPDILPVFTLGASAWIAPSDNGVVLDAGYVDDSFLNVSDSGGVTTALITPPSGKTTADFGGGRIQDDINPGLPVNLPDSFYREDETSIQAATDAATGNIYEFRLVVSNGTEFDTYAVLPAWTIGAASGTTDAAASASGVATVAAVGETIKQAVAAAAGSSTVAAVGGSIAAAVGSSSGVGTASGIGRATTAGVASSSAVATVAAIGSTTAASTASAAAIGSATGIGSSTAIAVASSAATGTATSVGSSTAASIAASSGTGTATGIAPAATTDGVGAAAGAGSATGIGASTAASVGAAAANGTANGVATSTAASIAAATAAATVLAIGASIAAGVAAAVGTSSILGSSVTTTDAVAAAAGSGTALAVGRATAASIAAAAGTGTATGAGAGTTAGVGSSAGVAAVNALSIAINAAFGSSTATSSAQAIGIGSLGAVGSSSGAGSAAAAGGSIAASIASPTPPVVIHYGGTSPAPAISQTSTDPLSIVGTGSSGTGFNLSLFTVDQLSTDPAPVFTTDHFLGSGVLAMGSQFLPGSVIATAKLASTVWPIGKSILHVEMSLKWYGTAFGIERVMGGPALLLSGTQAGGNAQGIAAMLEVSEQFAGDDFYRFQLVAIHSNSIEVLGFVEISTGLSGLNDRLILEYDSVTNKIALYTDFQFAGGLVKQLEIANPNGTSGSPGFAFYRTGGNGFLGFDNFLAAFAYDSYAVGVAIYTAESVGFAAATSSAQALSARDLLLLTLTEALVTDIALSEGLVTQVDLEDSLV